VKDRVVEESWTVVTARETTNQLSTTGPVAHSKGYFSSNQVIQITDSVMHRRETISSGALKRFSSDTQTTRMFLLTAGKIHVCVEGQPEFILGQEGMFVLRPGQACTVLNKAYIDAALHITTLPA
jgi:hypothetical protein